MNRYYYSDGLREFGPFMVREMMGKKLRPNFMVREANEIDMKPISEHPELRFIVGTKAAFETNSEFKKLNQEKPSHGQINKTENEPEK